MLGLVKMDMAAAAMTFLKPSVLKQPNEVVEINVAI